MDEQRQVAAFVATHDLDTEPANQMLDLISEVGEVAKEVNLSTNYGQTETVEIPADELGDALFALLALAEAVDVDAEAALEIAMAKYTDRLEKTGDAGSD